MSATVSYKGNTLTTVNNQTRVLNTSGKWLEDDITIVDVTSSGGGTPAISVVDTLDAKGGTVRTITALDISDTTATASDVAIGKYFYTSNGTKTAGANSGGSSGQSVTGTVTGDGTTVLSIPCSFAPDLIYVHTDMSSDVSNRGIVLLTIIKDKTIHVVSDTSTSSDILNSVYMARDITGYNDNTNPHASYSNNILTLDMVNNTSSHKFLFGQTYTYELSTLGSGTPSATAHTIYFEFTDGTNASIVVYYDNSFVGSAITATKPVTYNNKTVTLAQLDGVTWYEPVSIPIGVELIDYSKLTANTAINNQGQVESTEWYYTSDYTVVDPSMTFEYTASYWHYIGVYDENKNVLRTIYAYQDSTVSSQDSNIGLGTLSGSELTNAKYVRICSSYQNSSGMSLIRTA